MVVSNNKKLLLIALLALCSGISAMEQPEKNEPDYLSNLPAEIHPIIAGYLTFSNFDESIKNRVAVGRCNKVLFDNYLSPLVMKRFFKGYLVHNQNELVKIFKHPNDEVKKGFVACLKNLEFPLHEIRDERNWGAEYHLLYRAIELNDVKSLKYYLDNGADVNHTIITIKEDGFGNGRLKSHSLLICALIEKLCKPKISNAIIELLLNYGADVNFAGLSDSQLPLYLAINTRDYELAKKILDKGAKPDAVIGENNDTVLMSLAAGLEQQPATITNKIISSIPFFKENKKPCTEKDLMELLLLYGANPNIKALDGNTALIYSIDNFEKVKLLLDYGADRSIANNGRRTALRYAQRAGDRKIIGLLENYKN